MTAFERPQTYLHVRANMLYHIRNRRTTGWLYVQSLDIRGAVLDTRHPAILESTESGAQLFSLTGATILAHVTSVKMQRMPALPKGVPTPPTAFTLYIAKKQWIKVRETIQNPRMC